MSGALAGKVAIVTGGAGGIGSAIAEGYAREGAIVCVADISGDMASSTARTIGGNAFGVALDVTRPPSIQAMVDAVVERAGGIDILVNNAGVYGVEPILDITEAEFDRIFAVNAKGLLFTLQAVARCMIAQGRRGSVINIASAAGRRGFALPVVYAASKAAAINLSQSAGLALIKNGIRVNAIAPGAVDTPMWKEVDAMFAAHGDMTPGAMTEISIAATPYGRLGRPDDYVGTAIFLASDWAEFIVAQTLTVDGGQYPG